MQYLPTMIGDVLAWVNWDFLTIPILEYLE